MNLQDRHSALGTRTLGDAPRVPLPIGKRGEKSGMAAECCFEALTIFQRIRDFNGVGLKKSTAP